MRVAGVEVGHHTLPHHLTPRCIRVTTHERAMEQAATIIWLTDKKHPITGCYFNNLKRMPDIEIYIDGVGQAAAEPSTTRVARIFIETLIHEICHHEGFNEEQARAATKRVMMAMEGGPQPVSALVGLNCSKSGGSA